MVDAMESLKNFAVSDFPYFKRWYDFNFNIEGYLPAADLEKYFKAQGRDAFNILSRSECARTITRKKLLAAFGLDGSVDYDIGSDVMRLVMAGKAALEQAAIISGAIFYHKAVLKIISKKELDVLVKYIGDSIYSFIVKRGMVLWKMVPDIKVECPGSTMEKIPVVGKKILCMSLCGIPGGVRKRLDLMFGEVMEIPEKCDEMLAKKCFDLINLSLSMVKNVEDV